MPRWQRKAARDALKALLPFQSTLRRIKRSIKPYATDPANDKHLLSDGLRQILELQRFSIHLHDATVVELGTGWIPILPFLFRLYGAAKVITVDLERLLDLRQVRAAYDFLRKNLDESRHQAHLHDVPDFTKLTVAAPSLEQALIASKVDYRAPFNFFNLPERAADLIVSRAVLEHIPEKRLRAIFAHARRVLRGGGIMCHSIDMSDHWEHVDKDISKVNFLQYDGLGWSLAGINPQNYQNRLRRSEYIKMIEESGFEVLMADGSPHPAAMTALRQLPLISRYKDLPLEELAIVETTIVARKP